MADINHTSLPFRTHFIHSGAGDGIFMSKTADLSIVTDGLRVLEPRVDSLSRWIDNLAFFLIIRKNVIDLGLVYAVFSRGQEVD